MKVRITKMTITIKTLNADDVAWFGRFYPKHNVIGDMVFTDDKTGETYDKIIVKMKPGCNGYTPTGTVRDCGDHYIEAKYSRFDKIDKKTLDITKDVEDK